MMSKIVGDTGEKVAKEFLLRKGYKFLLSNYRNRFGEIDLIFKYRVGNLDMIIFVEVKTKTGNSYEEPEDMFSTWKASQVRRMAELWCQEYEWKGLCRIDVVGVVFNYMGEVEDVRHFEDVCMMG